MSAEDGTFASPEDCSTEGLSPALLVAIEAALTATKDPSKQCFQNMFPESVMKAQIVHDVRGALAQGMSEADLIAQMKEFYVQ